MDYVNLIVTRFFLPLGIAIVFVEHVIWMADGHGQNELQSTALKKYKRRLKNAFERIKKINGEFIFCVCVHGEILIYILEFRGNNKKKSEQLSK